ncbi:MAG: hypothetical protein ABH986_00335 [archaeon]
MRKPKKIAFNSRKHSVFDPKQHIERRVNPPKSKRKTAGKKVFEIPFKRFQEGVKKGTIGRRVLVKGIQYIEAPAGYRVKVAGKKKTVSGRQKIVSVFMRDRRTKPFKYKKKSKPKPLGRKEHIRLNQPKRTSIIRPKK